MEAGARRKLFALMLLALILLASKFVQGEVAEEEEEEEEQAAEEGEEGEVEGGGEEEETPTWMKALAPVLSVVPDDLRCAPKCIIDRLCFVRKFRACRTVMWQSSYFVCVLAALDVCDLMHADRMASRSPEPADPRYEEAHR